MHKEFKTYLNEDAQIFWEKDCLKKKQTNKVCLFLVKDFKKGFLSFLFGFL